MAEAKKATQKAKPAAAKTAGTKTAKTAGTKTAKTAAKTAGAKPASAKAAKSAPATKRKASAAAAAKRSATAKTGKTAPAKKTSMSLPTFVQYSQAPRVESAAPVRRSTNTQARTAGTTPVRRSTNTQARTAGTAPVRRSANTQARTAGAYPTARSVSARRSPNAAPRTAAPVKRKRLTPAQRRKRMALRVWESFLLTAALLACIVFIFVRKTEREANYKNYLIMNQTVTNARFFEGTSVEGVDVADMTLDEAIAHWENDIEPTYANRTVYLDNGTSYTAAELGYSSDYREVLEEAFYAGRAGTLEERYRLITERANGGKTEFTVTRSLYSQSVLEEYVWGIAKRLDVAPTQPKMVSFDLETNTFGFSGDAPGQKLDRDALMADMKGALENGGGNVTLKVDAVAPDLTVDELRVQYGLVSTVQTDASKSNKERLSNVQRACVLLDGQEIAAGATFSFNDCIGERTEERGFKMAAAYSDGSVIQELGGGICQISTTLFNAAVKADLRIRERHPHSLIVSYVEPGKDAAVNWRSKDLRITNNQEGSVYIRATVTKDKHVVIEIYGKKLDDGMTIELETRNVKEVPFTETVQVNETMAPGKSKIVQEGKSGYSATTYKIYYDVNGEKVKSAKLFDSTYAPTTQIVEVGPAA